MFDLSSEVNHMISFYTDKLGFTSLISTITIQKINGLALKTNRIVLAKFLISNKLDRTWLFEKTFLLAYTSMEIILEIIFPSFSNINL